MRGDAIRSWSNGVTSAIVFGATGMLQGMKEPYRKGESDSILALSLAIAAARLQSNVTRASMGRAIELRKRLIQKRS